MKFCMVTTFYPPCHSGGDATYVRALSEKLSAPCRSCRLIEHYWRACAVILPSLARETFGLTVVKALACGTPTIVRAVETSI